LHTVLLPVAAAPVVSHDRCHGSLALATPAYEGRQSTIMQPCIRCICPGGQPMPHGGSCQQKTCSLYSMKQCISAFCVSHLREGFWTVLDNSPTVSGGLVRQATLTEESRSAIMGHYRGT